MNQDAKIRVPGWYWAIGIAAVLWNLMGCMIFVTELVAQEAMMKEWTEPQREWARSIPSWIYIMYGAAVGSGLLGSVALLIRKSWAIPLFAICLVTVLIQMTYTMLIAGGLQAMGPGSMIMPGLVISLAAILLWFAWFAKGKGWLAG